jgi:hypothetical protein
VAAQLEAVQGQVASVSGNVLVVSESLEKLTADVVALKQQQKGSKQQPASAAGDSSRVSALEAELAEHRQQLAQLGAQLAEARSTAASAQRVLTAAGLTQEADARDMQDVLDNAAQTYVESQQLRDELKQMRLLVKELEARSNEHISSTRASLGQLQQQVGPHGSQVQLAAWAPKEWGSDKVMYELASAAGVSSKALIGGHCAYTPKPAGSSAGGTGQAAGSNGGSAAGAGGDGGGSSSGSGGAAGSSGQQQQQQQQQQRGSDRQPLSLYIIQLSHPRYLQICLGGKCRTVLKGRQLPLYVDTALTDEERAERRRLAPLVQELRAKRVPLRWKGTKLEQLVARASGRKQWREVNPLPPEGAAGQMAGDGVGEVQ